MICRHPDVSVIVPVFNTEPYLRKCLDSIVRQTLVDIEIICVDDGSTDGSLAVLEEYGAKDSRIKILRQKNQGAGEARNAGMRMAEGEFLFFFDADDFARPAMLERMSVFARENDADVVVSEFYNYDSSLRAVYGKHKLPLDLTDMKIASGKDVRDRIFRVFKWSPWNKLFKRSFIQRHSVVWQNSFRCNDIAFVNVALALANRIGFLPESYYYYREHSGVNLSAKRNSSSHAQYEAWRETRRRLQAYGIFSVFSDDFKRAVYIGAMKTLFVISDPEALNSFFRGLKEMIIPDMGLRGDIFTEETNTYLYRALAADIETFDTPLPFIARYRVLHEADVRRRLSRHLLVEKKLRAELRSLLGKKVKNETNDVKAPKCLDGVSSQKKTWWFRLKAGMGAQ